MAVIGPASQRRGQADRPARQHADPQVRRHGPAVRADRRGLAQDGRRRSSGTPWSRSGPTSSAATATASISRPRRSSPQAFGPSTTETCNTYNMLKLTRHLFCWDPQAEYADYYERALYNHILASQNPETGMMCYYVPLRSGSRKNYNGPLDCVLVLHGHGRREPREVRRQHLLPRRRQDALREPVHRLGTELEGQGRQGAAGDEVSRRGRARGSSSPARSRPS